MDCSLPSSSVYGIFQARILEWVAISSSRGSSRPRDRIPSLALTFYHWATWEDTMVPKRNHGDSETCSHTHTHMQAHTQNKTYFVILPKSTIVWISFWCFLNYVCIDFHIINCPVFRLPPHLLTLFSGILGILTVLSHEWSIQCFLSFDPCYSKCQEFSLFFLAFPLYFLSILHVINLSLPSPHPIFAYVCMGRFHRKFE